MREPTIAQEHFARMIAFWHGATMVQGNKTMAAVHGFGSWGRSPDLYADQHWREYVPAAQAVLDER